MATGLSTLETGKRALAAQRLGLDITSNNIANVNTEGYSRRTAVITESTPWNNAGTFRGTGVVADTIKTYREEFFDREIRNNISRQSTYESDVQIYTRVEAILAEPSDSGLGSVVEDFFNSFRELSSKPESIAFRTNVLNNAETMVYRLNTTAAQFSDLRNEVGDTLYRKVDNANTLIKEITQYNKEININRSKNGQAAQAYVDGREAKLEELSELININVTQNDDGTINVFSGGINLVTGPIANSLKLNEKVDSVTGERTFSLRKIDSGNNALSNIKPQDGEIAALMHHYNVSLDENDSSGDYSAYTDLNNLVNTLVTKVNDITVSGFGLNDTDAAAPGRTFFEPSDGSAGMLNIQLSDDIKDNPADIPVSSAVGEAGNNQIALDIANLSDDTGFLDGTTPNEYYTNYLAGFAGLKREAENNSTTAVLVTDQMKSQRESVIGVNTDEEAINLIKYQKSFEAASRVINTIDEMLTTIVNLGR